MLQVQAPPLSQSCCTVSIRWSLLASLWVSSWEVCRLTMHTSYHFTCNTAVAERGRVFPAMIFTFVWMTTVYCPLAMWAWGVHGWGLSWGVLDYAGNFCNLFQPSLLLTNMQVEDLSR